MRDHCHGDGDFLPPASFPNRINEGSGLQRPGCISCRGKLNLNRTVAQLVTPEDFTQPVTSVLPLKGREGAQFLLFRREDKDSRG